MGFHADTPSFSVTFVGHSTVLFDAGGVRLLTDPLLRKRTGVLIRRTAPPAAELRRDLDAVLISHAHLDHLDVPSLRMIDRRTPVIAPKGVGTLLLRQGFVPVELEVGDEVEVPRLSRAGGGAGGGRRAAARGAKPLPRPSA